MFSSLSGWSCKTFRGSHSGQTPGDQERDDEKVWVKEAAVLPSRSLQLGQREIHQVGLFKNNNSPHYVLGKIHGCNFI